ncbi:class II fructose-bisphosphate aldolase [Neglectibacter caecimuris]|uniref:class II fructose-bisphosphate aldolase n=1 Tax=Neglectibacter caecimuris TaxID=3093658 RepID=UPI002AC94390|nr:class II fructose-bisphosphate aldolase [Neglectibacter sp. M00184]
MLITLKEILELAEKKKIAVGAFNAANLESLRAIIDAAEELALPVILQFAQCHEPWVPLALIGPVMVDAAKKASVPVCVHLDHGETLEYLEEALKLGFTGIMYDGSTLPYEENLENTGKAVAMAKAAGASVEAELGSMGKRESGTGEESGEKDNTKIYTNPQKAKEFVLSSGIDALACSFGTTHGIYLSEPKLNFSIVEEVRALTGGIPVVMHGGSGIGKEDFQRAIRAGVRKINYFTYMDKAGGGAAEDYLQHLQREPRFFSSISAAARTAMQENVKSAMKIFSFQE